MILRKTRVLAIMLIAVLLMPSLTVNAAQQTPSGIPFSELEGRIDALMGEHIGISVPGAAIVVVHEGEIIFSRGYGWADIENRIPVDPAATVFEYGSINKLFVWVAVMQLVEQGLLCLDTDVRAYLPDTFVFEKPFTMRDLMNHSAGFADILLGLITDEQRAGRLGSLEEVLLEAQPPQIHVPGTVSAYSNWGATLAAFIVEYVSGQDYTAFEREHILLPAGMDNTLNQPDWLGNSAFLANKANGYMPDGQGGFRPGQWAHIPLYPTGAMNGTAEDLAAFLIALTPEAGESGPLFAYAATLEVLFSPASSDPVSRPGTYHGFTRYYGAALTVGHAGGTVAFHTDAVILPESRFGFVILGNAAWPLEIIPAVHELLLGSPGTPAAGHNLPCTTTVEGRFLPARRYAGNFLEFFTYLGLGTGPIMQISSFDENKVQISLGGGFSAIFMQTEPYIFHLYDSPDLNPLFFTGSTRFRVQMEDGVPRQIIFGNGGDFTALPPGRSVPFLIASLVIILSSMAFFIVAPIALLILFLRKKKKAPTLFGRLYKGFLLSGTLLALNNFALFGRFGINPFRMASEVAFHIWLNYAITGIAVVLCAVTAFLLIKNADKIKTHGKVFYGATVSFTALLVFVLHNWNFFVLL